MSLLEEYLDRFGDHRPLGHECHLGPEFRFRLGGFLVEPGKPVRQELPGLPIRQDMSEVFR